MKKFIYLNYSIIVMAGVLTACSMFSPVETAQTNNYMLNSLPSVTDQQKISSKTLMVMLPEANPIYSTRDMAYTSYPYQIAYFAHNRWADTPPQMLKSLLVQTLQNTHHFKNIVTLPFAGKYDYILNTQLIELQQDFSKNPSAVSVKMQAQLLNANNQLIFSKDFNVRIVTSQNTPYSGVIAINQAVEQILKRIAELCLIATKGEDV